MYWFRTLSLATWLLLASARPVTYKDRRAHDLTALVVFGDSLCDDGSGVFPLSNGSWPPTQYGYDQGRFSNGPVWPEYLARNLSIALYDYAYGGATTSNIIIQGYSGSRSTIPVPSVDEQVSRFLDNKPSGLDVNTTLFAVTGGVNDVLLDANASAWTATSVLAQQISRLEKVGAQNFLLFNYYDISLIPYDSYVEPALKETYYQFSADLEQALTKLQRATPGSYFFSFARSLFPRLYFYGEPTDYGLDSYGAYGSCVTGIYAETPNITVCSDPSKKVFWDEYHPTTNMHALVAAGMLEKLRE